jgi:hypothetical protein
MAPIGILSDHEHPAVKAKAKELTRDQDSVMDKLRSIFHFLRDEIMFGFPPKWDEVKASEVLDYGYGYCNTKAILFLALCKASGINARIHNGSINIEIMRGIFPSFAFPFLPDSGGHSWVDVEIEGEWKSIDSYINDKVLYNNALDELKMSGRTTGYSISLMDGKSSCDFNFGEKGFVHMGAVVEDHCTYQDLSEYMATDKYFRMNRLQLMSFPLIASMSNRNIERIRSK